MKEKNEVSLEQKWEESEDWRKRIEGQEDSRCLVCNNTIETHFVMKDKKIGLRDETKMNEDREEMNEWSKWIRGKKGNFLSLVCIFLW